MTLFKHIFTPLKSHFLIIALAVAYLVFAFTTYRTYGITYDENNVFTRANALYLHLLTNDTNPDVSYGLLVQGYPEDVNPFYNNTYGMILRIFNPQQDYELYHLYNLLFGGLVLIASYALLYSFTKSQFKAILGPVFILLSPIFFGYTPVDPKDMPFAVFFFLSLTAIYFTGKKNSLLSLLILGILFGLTQSGRIIGLALYPILLMYRAYLSVDDFKNMSIKKMTSHLFQELLFVGLVFIIGSFIMAITWPYLGSNFFKHFVKMLGVAKDFPWDRTVLFNGLLYAGNHLPRFYVPTMFLIKTPVFILFFFAMSLYFFTKKSSNKLLALLWMVIILTFGMYIVLRPVSVLRHYLFIFPIMSTIAAIGCIHFLRYFSKQMKIIVILLALLSAAFAVFNMVKLFPYEYLYFNELVGGVDNAKTKYSVDTWSQGNKAGALWLAEYTKDKNKEGYDVAVCGNPLSAFYYFPSWLRYSKSLLGADYLVCAPLISGQDKFVNGTLIHTITKDGVVINRIYKMIK